MTVTKIHNLIQYDQNKKLCEYEENHVSEQVNHKL
jgi:hypothetical protein